MPIWVRRQFSPTNSPDAVTTRRESWLLDLSSDWSRECPVNLEGLVLDAGDEPSLEISAVSARERSDCLCGPAAAVVVARHV